MPSADAIDVKNWRGLVYFLSFPRRGGLGRIKTLCDCPECVAGGVCGPELRRKVLAAAAIGRRELWPEDCE